MIQQWNKRHTAQARVLGATILAYASYHIVKLNLTQASPALIEYDGFSKGTIGLLLAILAVSYGSSKFILGIVADRIRPRLLISIGLFLSSVADLLLGQTHNHYIMAALMAALGLTQGCGAPSCQKLITEWFQRKRLATAISCWHVSHNLGSGASAIIVAVIISYYGGQNTKNIFLIPAIISMAMAVIVYWLGKDAPMHTGKVKDNGHLFWNEFANHLLKNPLMWILGFLNAFSYILRYGIENWIPTYLELTKNFTVTQTATAFSWFEYAAIPGTILLGLASDRWLKGRRLPLVIGTALLVIFTLPLYVVTASSLVVNMTVAVMGICVYGQQSLLNIMVLDVLPIRYAASGIGMLGFFGYAFGQVIASYGIGELVEKTNWQWGFAIIFTAGIICVVIFSWLEIYSKHQL